MYPLPFGSGPIDGNTVHDPSQDRCALFWRAALELDRPEHEGADGPSSLTVLKHLRLVLQLSILELNVDPKDDPSFLESLYLCRLKGVYSHCSRTAETSLSDCPAIVEASPESELPAAAIHTIHSDCSREEHTLIACTESAIHSPHLHFIFRQDRFGFFELAPSPGSKGFSQRSMLMRINKDAGTRPVRVSDFVTAPPKPDPAEHSGIRCGVYLSRREMLSMLSPDDGQSNLRGGRTSPAQRSGMDELDMLVREFALRDAQASEEKQPTRTDGSITNEEEKQKKQTDTDSWQWVDRSGLTHDLKDAT